MPPDTSSPSAVRLLRTGVVASMVLVFAVIVAGATIVLRTGLREQILRREATILAMFVSTQLEDSAGELKATTPIADVPGTLLAAVLKAIPKFPDVVGVQLFDRKNAPSGGFPAVAWSKTPPSESQWVRLGNGEAFGSLHESIAIEDIVEAAPAFEVWAPLRLSSSGELLGAAQFVVDGSAIQKQIKEHDGRLIKQALIAWVGGSIAIMLALGWAFRRLDAANRELRARTEDLERANRELVLAAKTSALGAVTAHLMHELKNPIAGLEGIVRGQDASATTLPGGELAAASELTRRLRAMVNDVVGVLRDEQTGAKFELSSIDIAEVAASKVRTDAEQRGVKVQMIASGDVNFPARRANLATLVLRNLLQNAVEASSTGEVVRLTVRKAGEGGAEFLVEDFGRGLPPEVRAKIFQPCASTKIGGSGIGLALSYQLAQRAGGKLEIVRSDELGTCFRLVLTAEA